METPALQAFIRRHSSLFWYIPDDRKETVSLELVVETIFNYGEMDDVRELFEIVGIKEVAKVFFGMEGRKIQNFYPEIYNYFSLLLKKYAS